MRSIADSLYSLSPVGEPGNDDLGAMASWYVWAALGLYPLTPGTADLVMASPMFSRVTVHLADGHVLQDRGQRAPRTSMSGRPGWRSARATAATLDRPWLPASVLRGGGTLDLSLSKKPNRSWGARPQDAPPSYGTGAAGAVGFVKPSGSVTVEPGTATSVTLGAQSGTSGPVSVSWKASAPSGVTVEPAAGTFELRGGTTGGRTARASATLHVTAATAGTFDLHVAFADPGGADPVPPVTLVVQASG